jgi:methionyl-tRNA synthetase
MIQQQRKVEEGNSIMNMIKQVISLEPKGKSEEVIVEEKPKTEPVDDKYISIDDFAKVEIRVGTILSTEIVDKSDKLYKLSVDFGEEAPRQVLSGIRKFVTAEELVGKQFPFVTNLAPRPMMGMESAAMILAASEKTEEGEKLALFNPSIKVANGTKLR